MEGIVALEEKEFFENMYMIIKLDCINNTIEIIGTFEERKDALMYMTLKISTDIEINNNHWYQKIIESDDVISIYEAHYVMKKTLRYKYFIKHY